MAYLIDSDVLIWHLRGHQPTVQLLRALVRKSGQEEQVLPLGCSVISVFEVWAGMRPVEKASTEKLLDSLARYPVDEIIAKQAADYYKAFAKQGITLHIADLIIAATAVSHNLTLISYNLKHFPMEDISIYKPMAEF